ncbi:1-deoxy-D-xylulose-5-phosphate reductoisomerase [Crateriforma spongiae]|uniref:1-deoxy-D-xylulose-5-phosphate reductoisomerase n=1 Tax=Crateriforma spongiae TaxID=2724528 RepID=UPI001F0270B0|nr:1-deoxy-D-xylulose-5-phosphate reductoisomerase [Crateriforma spongiae]
MAFSEPDSATMIDATQCEASDPPARRVCILGATGSIGRSTMEVVAHLRKVDPEYRWQVWAASGHRNLDTLAEVALSADPVPRRLVASCAQTHARVSGNGESPLARFSGEILAGPDALVRVATDPEVDVLVAAIVGRAGLESTLAAVQEGKRVALANKETLVVAGPIVRQAAQKSGAELLPVDSEHSALFQCLGDRPDDVEKLILTASGGPFRDWSIEQMRQASVQAALNHPTWDMGAKITIDSATMMNKALEIIEARWLFDVPAETIEVVVHPQSIVHSLVEFRDHSVISQWSPPDMRLPIQYALTYPRRLPGVAKRWSRQQPCQLEMLPADRERFPALDLGFEVARVGGTAGAVVNAANEVAVGLFLDGQIRFTDIVKSCHQVLQHHQFDATPTLADLVQIDQWARQETLRFADGL